MARQHFTRQEAIEYLAGRTDLSFAKPLVEYKTPYLKRIASEYKRAEQAGRESPQRKEIRGHAKERIRYHEKNNQFAESYEVGNKRYPVRADEIPQLQEKVGTSPSGFYHIIDYGIPVNYGANWDNPKKPDYRTYRTRKMTFDAAQEQSEGNMAKFAEIATGQEWSKVYAIAMRAAPENPYGKTARRRKG